MILSPKSSPVYRDGDTAGNAVVHASNNRLARFAICGNHKTSIEPTGESGPAEERGLEAEFKARFEQPDSSPNRVAPESTSTRKLDNAKHGVSMHRQS